MPRFPSATFWPLACAHPGCTETSVTTKKFKHAWYCKPAHFPLCPGGNPVENLRKARCTDPACPACARRGRQVVRFAWREERRCLTIGCNRPFMPNHPKQVYHSDACKKATWGRDKRAARLGAWQRDVLQRLAKIKEAGR